jgi:hypothetical protein
MKDTKSLNSECNAFDGNEAIHLLLFQDDQVEFLNHDPLKH